MDTHFKRRCRSDSSVLLSIRKDIFMDYHNNPDWQPGNEQMPPGSSRRYRTPAPYSKSNGFATASLVLGIIALVSAFSMTILPPLIFGSLSIILGILSRGNQKLHSRAFAGVIVSTAALVLNLVICVFSFYMVFSDPDARSQYWSLVNETYEQMLGTSLDEILESYGVDPGQLR